MPKWVTAPLQSPCSQCLLSSILGVCSIYNIGRDAVGFSPAKPWLLPCAGTIQAWWQLWQWPLPPLLSERSCSGCVHVSALPVRVFMTVLLISTESAALYAHTELSIHVLASVRPLTVAGSLFYQDRRLHGCLYQLVPGHAQSRAVPSSADETGLTPCPYTTEQPSCTTSHGKPKYFDRCISHLKKPSNTPKSKQNPRPVFPSSPLWSVLLQLF